MTTYTNITYQDVAHTDVAYLAAEERASRPGILATLLAVVVAAALTYSLWFVVTAEANVPQPPEEIPACVVMGTVCPPL